MDPPAQGARGTPLRGYYRFPAIHGDTVVFTAEGDLWRTSVQGGVARRLTTHPGEESHAAISPDGHLIAFSAEYEGPTEVYTMPMEGGLPTRRTAEGWAQVVGWTPDGKIVCATYHRSRLPDQQLMTVELGSGTSALLPLSQAADGVFEPSGRTLFFNRLPYHPGSVKRYKGGTVETLWKFTLDEPEAVPLTADYPGPSCFPMWWDGRVYFVTDRDGTMNLWSMSPTGDDRRQLTTHQGWDVKWPDLSQGRIVYQLGADVRLFDIASGNDRILPITLVSDWDQQREKWVKKAMDYVTSAHLSPQGDRVVLTARGQVFVVPVGPGRRVEATRNSSVRYREAQFLPDGKSLLALSDESGELEFVTLPANGVGRAEPLTSDGTVFRDRGVPSPDGKWLVYDDKNNELWLFNVEDKQSKRIAASKHYNFGDLVWSPDSQWLAYVAMAPNLYQQIWLYRLSDGTRTALTSDRVSSHSPAWSPDGKWIYFLSDRHLESLVPEPFGPRQPEPFFDKPTRLYLTPLTPDQRSPFEAADELHPKDKSPEADSAKAKITDGKDKSGAAPKSGSTNRPPEVVIDLNGIRERTMVVPVPPGNYGWLSVNDTRLFWRSWAAGSDDKYQLMMLEITNEEPKAKTLVEEIRSYELSRDGQKLLIRKGDTFHVEDASAGAPAKLEKSVDLKDWTFSLTPRDEWRQMFIEAWRLERDYFYDRKLHGVDWAAILKKHLPLVDRVTTRAELSDLISDMVGELSALHIFVFGGDHRAGSDQIKAAGLGAVLSRDEPSGGWRIDHIYRSDPDYPEKLAPLAKPGLGLKERDVIVMINGVAALSVPHPDWLLRNQAGRQVLLQVKSPGSLSSREVVVTPINEDQEDDLRYGEWEYTRRLRVEELGQGQIGYVHLRYMGKDNMAEWARDYYPVYQRQGLIIDMRHNKGGNINSWILERLLRKAWAYWQPRVGEPDWNMPYAFRGHLVVLCDELTSSDGETFTEGFKRLGLGKVIGTRTWGGGIWLSFSNWLVDKGIASAAETGVYGPEGKWLVEGHGVDPDIVVDNLPHATYQGHDAQLEKAIDYLQDQIRRQPVPVQPAPPYPDKSFR